MHMQVCSFLGTFVNSFISSNHFILGRDTMIVGSMVLQLEVLLPHSFMVPGLILTSDLRLLSVWSFTHGCPPVSSQKYGDR